MNNKVFAPGLKKIFLLMLCFGLVQVFLGAQTTADEMETLLASSAVSYAQASRFTLEAADVMVTADPAEAFRYASEQKWLPKKAAPGDTARLDAISLLIMRSFGIKGGLLYSISKSPHFAYRELVYRDIIQGRTDPAMNCSGETLLFIISRLLPQEPEVTAAAIVYDSQTPLEDEEEQQKLMAAEAERQRLAALEAERQRIAASAAERQRLEEEEAQRRKLAEEINTQIEEHQLSDTRASVTAEGVTINLSDIQFLPDSSILTETEKARIREIAQILIAVPGRRILVAGHTALAGTEAGRRTISLQRAQAVADYLVALGARRREEITALGYGADRPIADNRIASGMAANRRVEITFLED